MISLLDIKVIDPSLFLSRSSSSTLEIEMEIETQL
jgi:hypothetical protein